MYAAPHAPFRPPSPAPKKRRRAGRPSNLLANVPKFADMAELDAWVESCKIAPTARRSRRRMGVLSESEWASRQEDEAPGVLTGTWEQEKGVYRYRPPR